MSYNLRVQVLIHSSRQIHFGHMRIQSSSQIYPMLCCIAVNLPPCCFLQKNRIFRSVYPSIYPSIHQYWETQFTVGNVMAWSLHFLKSEEWAFWCLVTTWQWLDLQLKYTRQDLFIFVYLQILDVVSRYQLCSREEQTVDLSGDEYTR